MLSPKERPAMKRTSLKRAVLLSLSGAAVCAGISVALAWPPADEPGNILTGAAAFSTIATEKPGLFRKITVADLPAPYATPSAANQSHIVPRPADASLQVPPGFQVRLFATGFNRPFGMAFYPPGSDPQFIYAGNTDSVVRLPYRNGDLKARGPAEVVVKSLPSGGGHWTRDIVFTRDARKMLVSVGSRSNVDDADNNPGEVNRADVLEFNPDGTAQRIFASGIRNCVGEAIQPETGDLWCSTNERDLLGNNLPPDYITHVQDGGFYGWPWYYTGGHQDPRHKGKHPELKDKVIVPDVLLQPHNASLEIAFYEGNQFPPEYKGQIFAAEHGSWNRETRTGYEVIRVQVERGKATGAYEDFVTGFATPDGQVWARPVGVTVASDGALLVSDDGSNSVWRVSYSGHPGSN